MGERTRYPPGTFSWTELYVTAASADETAQTADEAGGRVMAEPFDVMDAGRVPGSMTWNDLVTPDPEDRLLSAIEGLGGTLHDGPVRMPQGSIAAMGDPQGAVLTVWTGQYED